MSKVWVVTAICADRDGIERGDSNTGIVKVCKTKPTQDEVRLLVAKWAHEGLEDICDDEAKDDPEYTCIVCRPPKTTKLEMHDKDEFGNDEEFFGYLPDLTEADLDD